MKKLSFTLVILFGAIATIFLSPRAFAAISYVQTATSSETTGATSLGIKFGSNVNVGDALICAISTSGGTNSPATAVTDNQNDHFASTTLGRVFETNAQGNEFWYALNVAGGTTNVTTTENASLSIQLACSDYSGIATSNALDQVVATTSTAPVGNILLTGTTPTTTQANELLFAWFSTSYATNQITSVGTGWNNRGMPTQGQAQTDMIVSSVGQYQASSTATGAGAANSVAMLATFKATSAAIIIPPTADVTITNGCTISSGVII